MSTRRAALAAFLAAVSGGTHAEGVGLGLGIGTPGAGAQLVFRVQDNVNVRLGANGWNIRYDLDASGIDYKAKVRLGSVPLLVDWYPGSNNLFRITAGAYGNSNKVDVEARPRSGVFVVGNSTYGASEIGAFNGSVKYSAIGPYVGVGFGNPVRRGATWSWNVDVGLLYQGRPKASLQISCGTGISAARCAQLQNDAAIEASEFERDFRDYRVLPVAQFWVGRQF